MKDKNCIFCEYFYLNSGDPGYSEYTPGTDMSMSCLKNKWRFDPYRCDNNTFRKMLLTAINCQEYKDYQGNDK